MRRANPIRNTILSPDPHAVVCLKIDVHVARFSLSLAKLPPGEYNCQVTVVNPGEQKATFWQAPVMLIP